jgi:DNA-binding response OmpR family regulator
MILPFGIAELATRCDLALRRYHKSIDKDPVMRTGQLTIDLVSRAVAQAIAWNGHRFADTQRFSESPVAP